MKRGLSPFHPGVHVAVSVEALIESGTTQSQVAARLGLTSAELQGLLEGRVDVSPDLAQRLSATIGASPQFWLNLQTAYDEWCPPEGRS